MPVPCFDFYRPEIELLLHLARWLGPLGITLGILEASISPEEQSFYHLISAKTGWTYSTKEAGTINYKKLESYPIIFCTNSTLGH